MTDQIIAFLVKYQHMRTVQTEYFKTKNRGALIRAKQMEAELDKEAEQIKSSLQLN